MQRVGGVFRRAQRFQRRNIEVHLRRGFAAWRHQEIKLQTVDAQLFARFGDAFCRRDNRWIATRYGNTETIANITAGVFRQQQAVGVCGASTHDVACHHVLADRFLHKARGGDDLHLTGFYVIFRDEPFYAAIMVNVAMGINDGDNRLVRTVLEVEVEAGFSGWRGDQRVDNNNPRITFDKGDIRDVLTAHLVHAVGHFKQPGNTVYLRLTPQARVNGIRRWRIDIEFIIIGAVVGFTLVVF